MTLAQDILKSFNSLPVWVRIWLALILVPVHLAAGLFVFETGGLLIAVLAIGGMTPNLFLLLIQRGFSRTMAISHLVLWGPMVVIGVRMLANGEVSSSCFAAFLWVLLPVSFLSLLFDVRDTWLWWKGDRAVAGDRT